MKRFVLGAILLMSVALVALPADVEATPTVDHIQVRVPLEGLYVNTPEPCEDLVHIAGALHFAGHLTEMDNGERLLVLHSNPQEAVTQGVETGNIYRGVGVGHQVIRTLGPGESYTSVNVFLQVPHYGFQWVVHTTINANGELTAEIDHELSPGFSCVDLGD